MADIFKHQPYSKAPHRDLNHGRCDGLPSALINSSVCWHQLWPLIFRARPFALFWEHLRFLRAHQDLEDPVAMPRPCFVTTVCTKSVLALCLNRSRQRLRDHHVLPLAHDEIDGNRSRLAFSFVLWSNSTLWLYVVMMCQPMTLVASHCTAEVDLQVVVASRY